MFRDIQLHLARCIQLATLHGMDYWKPNHIAKPKIERKLDIKWHPSPIGWVKMNIDGSVQEWRGSTGFVIRDNDGHVLLDGAKNTGESKITVAEGIALRDGLVHALNHGWRNLIVEGHSKLIIDCVLKKVSVPWSVMLIVQDIWQINSSMLLLVSQNKWDEPYHLKS